jgi:hypothetical protein
MAMREKGRLSESQREARRMNGIFRTRERATRRFNKEIFVNI